MPVDAERWLAARGVERDPLLMGDRPDVPVVSAPVMPVPEVPALAVDPAGAPDRIGAVGAPAHLGVPEGDAFDEPDQTVDGALGFIRRSTANAPQSEGRLRSKLVDRGYTAELVDAALELARAERLVDDAALLAALIAERRMRGHADRRLRRDLRDRGFTGDQVDAALTTHAVTDPLAIVFELARDQAARHRAVDAEAAVRRTVGFLVRRGHSEALARKAARDAVYVDREGQRIAGR